MPAVTLATGRATLAGQVEGDGPDGRGYTGPPGWGLGVRLTTSPRKKSTVMSSNRRRLPGLGLSTSPWYFFRKAPLK